MTTATRNGRLPAEPRPAAAFYLDMGRLPVPVGFRSKIPWDHGANQPRRGWQELRPRPENLDGLFPAMTASNLGLLLGEPSGGLIDVDLDAPEAAAAGEYLLPVTGWQSGRKSKPRSHWWYEVADPPNRASDEYHDLDGSMLLEVRSTGGQTVVPPGLHESGERLVWHSFTEPAPLSFPNLLAAARTTAACALLARHWPKGGRHHARLALSGGLERAGWDEARITTFCTALAAATRADRKGERNAERVGRGTARRRAADRNTWGWPKLAELLGTDGPEVVRRVRDWLGLLPVLPELPLPDESPWPEPLASEAYHGLAGEIVRALEPESEADPAALLVQFLVAFGNVVGRGVSFRVESDDHHMNLYTVLVGQTSKARKGTSWGRIRALFHDAAPEWVDRRIVNGLSSGEGLIWHVRDPIKAREKVKPKGGGPTTTQEYDSDPGEPDKRLLVVEPEFAGVLKQTERQGNVLSAVLRLAWETGTLRTLTKNSPAKATGAHISIVGHITAEELRRCLSTTEAASGFANRFLWLCVRRSKCLPDGGRPVDLGPHVGRLQQAIQHARGCLVGMSLLTAFAASTAGEPPPEPGDQESRGWQLHRDADAQQLWHAVYPDLSEGKPGLSGALIARMEAQSMRLACLYALLDLANEIRPEHLLAALALVDYCERSVRHVFGDSLGDPVADELLRLLRACPAGLTRTEIRDYFQRHASADRVGRALGLLLQHHLARREQQQTRGRPAERWFAAARQG